MRLFALLLAALLPADAFAAPSRAPLRRAAPGRPAVAAARSASSLSALVSPALRAAPAGTPALPLSALPARVSDSATSRRAAPPPTALSALRLHGPRSARAAREGADGGRSAAAESFAAAAGLGELAAGRASLSAAPRGWAAEPAPARSAWGWLARLRPTTRKAPLLEKLLASVSLDDEGLPAQRAALEEAFAHLLRSPTARTYAERLVHEASPNLVVGFEDVPGSTLYAREDGSRAFTHDLARTYIFPEGRVAVRFNRHLLALTAEARREGMAPLLAHEMLSHALLNTLSRRDGVFDAFLVHELNEAHAWLLQWVVDYELDGRFETAEAWDHLADPAGYAREMRLLSVQYAMTFSDEDFKDIRAALARRRDAAREARDRARETLEDRRGWPSIVDAVQRERRIPDARLSLLRSEIAEWTRQTERWLETFEEIVAGVEDAILNLQGDADSILALSRASEHPFFAQVAGERDFLDARLRSLVSARRPRRERRAPGRPKGQLTWDDIMRYYERGPGRPRD